MKRTFTFLSCLIFQALPMGAKPLKVYILTGQSNMEGHAKVTTFDHIGMDPKTAPLLKEMRNADGSSKVLDDVWISYQTGDEGDQAVVGKLSAGFGSLKKKEVHGEKIGPEFTFGIYLSKLVDEPILLIKAAWGGKSLHTDFRPPSAGPYEFDGSLLAKFKSQGKNLGKVAAEKEEATGRYYRMMMEHVKAVLADPGKAHPAYDEKEGYELAGMVWFQGWNDMVDRGTYPDQAKRGGYDQYSEVLGHFIRDVRKELEVPELPFVIGVMGAGGPTKNYGKRMQRNVAAHQNFREAMAAPASQREFKGNVTAVFTENYWDAELDEVSEKKLKLKAEEKEIRKNGGTRKEQDEAIAKREEKAYTARDRELLKGISNADYHYKGSAKIMAQIGKAFAEAVYELGGK